MNNWLWVVLLNLYFSYAILLKGNLRANNSCLIRDVCLENPFCLMAIVKLCVLWPRLYILTNKDIVKDIVVGIGLGGINAV